MRKRAKLTQDELAIKLGIHKSGVSYSERHGNPTLIRLKEVAKACGLKRIVIEVQS